MVWRDCLLIVTITLGITGCAMNPSAVELDYGTSTKLAIMNQVLDPEASKNTAPVEGIDGMAALGIMESYLQTFTQAEPLGRLSTRIATKPLPQRPEVKEITYKGDPQIQIDMEQSVKPNEEQ